MLNKSEWVRGIQQAPVSGYLKTCQGRRGTSKQILENRGLVRHSNLDAVWGQAGHVDLFGVVVVIVVVVFVCNVLVDSWWFWSW